VFDERKKHSVSRVVGCGSRNREAGPAKCYRVGPQLEKEFIAADRQRGAKMGCNDFVFHQSAIDESQSATLKR
jgi:hypothetical protein